MGTVTPQAGAFRSEIETAAEADGYRGDYVGYGCIHYKSLLLGNACGMAIAAALTYFF